VTPNLNSNLAEALDTAVVGETVFFLLPGLVVRYNIPYNVFEETVKLSESKNLSILRYRHLALDSI